MVKNTSRRKIINKSIGYTTVNLFDINIVPAFSTFAYVALVFPSLLYPLWNNSLAWQVVAIIALLIMSIIVLTNKTNTINNRLILIISLLPIFIHSYSLKIGEYGFTMLWTICIILTVSISCYINSEFILKYIGIFSFIYAFFTVLSNFGLGPILSPYAKMYAGPITQGTIQTAGLTQHYTHNSLFICLSAIIWFSFCLSTNKLRYYLLTIISILGLIFTTKRGPLIAISLSLLITLYLCSKGSLSKKIIRFFPPAVVLLISFLVVYIIRPSLFSRFENKDNILSNRQYLWSYAWEFFKENPLIGKGWGYYSHNFSFSLSGVEVSNLNAHNTYLQLLAETGVLGATIFLSLFVFGLSKIHSILTTLVNKGMELKTEIVFSFAYQVFFLIHAITENALYDRITFLPYILALAFCLNGNNHD